MCLALPGRIIEIITTTPFCIANVDFLGTVREVCLNSVDAEVGDYVIVHAGLAIAVLPVQEAIDTIADIRKMAEHNERYL